jgi:hypothetical protein
MSDEIEIAESMMQVIGGKKCEPFDFIGIDLKVPKGVRLFSILGSPVVVPGPDGATRIYIHPDDVAIVREANKN